MVDSLYFIHEVADRGRLEGLAQVTRQRTDKCRGYGSSTAQAAGYGNRGVDGEGGVGLCAGKPIDGEPGGEGKRFVLRCLPQSDVFAKIGGRDGQTAAIGGWLNGGGGSHLRDRRGNGGLPIYDGMLAKENHFAGGCGSDRCGCHVVAPAL